MINSEKGKQITGSKWRCLLKQASHAKSVGAVAAENHTGRFKQDGDVCP